MMKKKMVGICELCGNIEVRPSPADTAVCQACYNHNPSAIVEVKLKTPSEVLRDMEHPNLTFELSSKNPITHSLAQNVKAKRFSKKQSGVTFTTSK